MSISVGFMVLSELIPPLPPRRAQDNPPPLPLHSPHTRYGCTRQASLDSPHAPLAAAGQEAHAASQLHHCATPTKAAVVTHAPPATAMATTTTAPSSSSINKQHHRRHGPQQHDPHLIDRSQCGTNGPDIRRPRGGAGIPLRASPTAASLGLQLHRAAAQGQCMWIFPLRSNCFSWNIFSLSAVSERAPMMELDGAIADYAIDDANDPGGVKLLENTSPNHNP
jgi:hypothetical protein